jgi:hypothetical protein
VLTLGTSLVVPKQGIALIKVDEVDLRVAAVAEDCQLRGAEHYLRLHVGSTPGRSGGNRAGLSRGAAGAAVARQGIDVGILSTVGLGVVHANSFGLDDVDEDTLGLPVAHAVDVLEVLVGFDAAERLPWEELREAIFEHDALSTDPLLELGCTVLPEGREFPNATQHLATFAQQISPFQLRVSFLRRDLRNSVAIEVS